MQTKEDRIIDASFQLFLRHGYRKVSMSDVAEAALMSRPSLYASFANKEAIFAELVRRQCERNLAETTARLNHVRGLHERLSCVFDIWVIEPVASVIDSENATELLANCAEFAPQALADLYEQMEAQLVAVLSDYPTGGSSQAAKDTARILRLAGSGIKSSTENLPELRRLVSGLISMAVAASGTASSD
ncbi:TetR/AcrR family transcriptional regulator [Pseudomonas sp.]|uniref:TetR/AcrR family transcriptional regulator n=1 Tax=Pseudomonas sp. TaxID=306 RepID=UPI0026101217|nr:helix-turn-helix domain-containing protein [Pseudomonas sp.]